MKRKKHSFAVHRRAFAIWQQFGFYPWKKPRKERKPGKEHDSGNFYKGAFDSIPFLNQDAKRTFSHLLLRPGYMIRDYIGGQHERYLAPLTALIVFYAFFALIAAILQPVQQRKELPQIVDASDIVIKWNQETPSSNIAMNVAKIVRGGYLYLHLDQFPDAVDTQHEKAIAALEGTLRSQGIPLFLGEFVFLWLSMLLALRRYKQGAGACAAASAYALCQFSFFMLFALLLTWGGKTSISVLLMLVLLTIDYRQWLKLPGKKSFWLSVRTGIYYGLLYFVMILLVSAVVIVAAMLR